MLDMEWPGQSPCLDSWSTLNGEHPFFSSLETRKITHGASVCLWMYLHTHIQRCVTIWYHSYLSFYVVICSFLTFNVAENCLQVSVENSAGILVEDTMYGMNFSSRCILGSHFGPWQLGCVSWSGYLSSSSLVFVERGALYLCVFFPYQFLVVFKHYFLKCLFGLAFLGFLWLGLMDGIHLSPSFSPLFRL